LVAALVAAAILVAAFYENRFNHEGHEGVLFSTGERRRKKVGQTPHLLTNFSIHEL